jgi:hypothetical protein
MRARKSGFVTMFCVFVGVFLAFGCGSSTGGGGGVVLHCGVGGACPEGFTCNASNLCLPGSADGGVTDTGGKNDAGSNGTDATTPDSQIDGAGTDAVTPDIAAPDTFKPDTAKPDVAAPDVQENGQTVSAIEQAATSAECGTPDSSTDIASSVTLEPVVVTSPPSTLKGSGSTYFTSFFVEAQNAPSDGIWSGLQVIVNADPFPVNVGDVLTITGTIKEFYCMTEITAAPGEVVISGNGGEPVPHGVLVSAFADGTAEMYEGDLIKLSVVQVQDPSPVSTDGKNHGECTINHNNGAANVNFAPPAGSAYLTPGTNGTTTTFTAGQAFASITGNLQWSFGHWVIRARTDADIVLK